MKNKSCAVCIHCETEEITKDNTDSEYQSSFKCWCCLEGEYKDPTIDAMCCDYFKNKWVKIPKNIADGVYSFSPLDRKLRCLVGSQRVPDEKITEFFEIKRNTYFK